MENETKNKLKKIKDFLEKKEKLSNMYEKKQKDISDKLWKLNDVQAKLYEYNDYKRNTHIALSAIILIISLYVTKNVLDQELITSILISLGLSSTSFICTHGFTRHKMNKLKKEHPEIDFENSNFDENEKKRQNLLKKQIEYSKKIGDIREMNQKCAYCIEELNNNENINSLRTCEILNQNNTCEKEKKKALKIQ